jgi:hypothetical protein
MPSPPPYSFVFLKLKITLKGRFQTAEDIITNATDNLKAITQTSFEQCFQKWKRWWERCIYYLLTNFGNFLNTPHMQIQRYGRVTLIAMFELCDHSNFYKTLRTSAIPS